LALAFFPLLLFSFILTFFASIIKFLHHVSQYEKLTDLELETYEEVVQELKELWVDLYGDEPISLETL